MTNGQPTPGELDAILTRRADAFTKDWLAKRTEIEQQRIRRSTRTTRQFWFLFVLVFASFILLAYRTEVQAQELRSGFYNACQARVAQAEQFNKGREGLINAVLNNPKNPVPADQRDAVVKQLEDGLLLPVEDCGVDPAQ